MAAPDKQTQKPGEAPPPSAAATEAKPLSPEAAALAKTRSDRLQMLSGIMEKKDQQAVQPQTAPASQTESPAASPTTKTGQVPTTAPQPEFMGARPQRGDEAEKGQSAKDFSAQLHRETSGGIGDVMRGLAESISRLRTMFGAMDFSNMLMNLAGKKPDKKGESYSKEDLARIKVDLDKDKDKVYPTQDKSAEYVSMVLGLPPMESPQKMLEAQKSAGMVFETDQGKLKDLKAGDVLYFQRKNAKGEPYAYLCGVVSSSEPLRMKTIPLTGGHPQEITVKESLYFKNEWYGFVRLPAGTGQAPTAKPAAPAEPAHPAKPAAP